MGAKEFIRYREMMARLAAPALRGVQAQTPDGPPAGSVLMGVPAALLLLNDDKELYGPLAGGLRQLGAMGRAANPSQGTPALRDPAGHTRKVYHPFVLHLHLAAFLRRYETLPAALWGACEEALADALLPARQIESYADKTPPTELTAVVLWHALCLLDEARLQSRDVDAELVDVVVHTLVHHPGPDQSLHPRTAEESLDVWTYRELTGLHALAALALARRNAAWSRRVEEIATHHLANSQPDHTSLEPWGVFAFLWSPQTRSFAEQQLQDATTFAAAAGEGLGALPAMLLADAADALATFAQ